MFSIYTVYGEVFILLWNGSSTNCVPWGHNVYLTQSQMLLLAAERGSLPPMQCHFVTFPNKQQSITRMEHEMFTEWFSIFSPSKIPKDFWNPDVLRPSLTLCPLHHTAFHLLCLTSLPLFIFSYPMSSKTCDPCYNFEKQQTAVVRLLELHSGGKKHPYAVMNPIGWSRLRPTLSVSLTELQ